MQYVYNIHRYLHRDKGEPRGALGWVWSMWRACTLNFWSPYIKKGRVISKDLKKLSVKSTRIPYLYRFGISLSRIL